MYYVSEPQLQLQLQPGLPNLPAANVQLYPPLSRGHATGQEQDRTAPSTWARHQTISPARRPLASQSARPSHRPQPPTPTTARQARANHPEPIGGFRFQSLGAAFDPAAAPPSENPQNRREYSAGRQAPAPCRAVPCRDATGVAAVPFPWSPRPAASSRTRARAQPGRRPKKPKTMPN